MKSHPCTMRFLPNQVPRGSDLNNNNYSAVDHSHKEPTRCLILRANGELSLLDLVDGRERELASSIELFWVTCGQIEGKINLIEDVSWLDYGHHGMQVWYPSPGFYPLKLEDFLQLDPGLEFDHEVYPLGLLPNAGVIVGISQRMFFSAHTEFPCFEPSPKAQTILHCLLRHLLQREKTEEALRLAQLSAGRPHFLCCLEWLLFTVFESEISRQKVAKIHIPNHSESCSLLEKTCDWIRNFPEYVDVVVSVARKTDARHWADLFFAAGRSTELFEECFQRRWYHTAACYILVIAKLEGPAVSQYCALRLLQETLDEPLYELAGELVQFLLRSGKENEQVAADAERQSPRFLGFFLFGSSQRKTSLPKTGGSFNDYQSPHVASVNHILDTHANYLMAGRELSKLVAFVKSTQFDLADYLQRERYGCAVMENFASELDLIGQKLPMGELQSRLDAEFLLVHVCSTQLKEWIAILATLLRRPEVSLACLFRISSFFSVSILLCCKQILLDLFHNDLRLWKAYTITLQSHAVFAAYHDLLKTLEEEMLATAMLE